MAPSGEARRLPTFGVLLGLAAFGAAYGQAALFYSNQNQYLLHGYAAAGHGDLRGDWLAQTIDPAPVFSLLVEVLVRLVGGWSFYACEFASLMLYAAAMLLVFACLANESPALRRWPVFLALLALTHSAAVRWLSYRVAGHDYPWFLQAGVAGQYILGAMFQPSVFGVLLVVGVAFFASGRAYLAAVVTVLAALVHPTYVLHAGFLILGMMASLAAAGQARKGIALGALALALVAPTVAYAIVQFAPTSPELFAEGQDILVHFRIPHHARPDLWLDEVAAGQVGLAVLGVALVWRTSLFWVLAVPLAAGTLLTLVQTATGSNTLALLFPWRISAVLVPLATTIVLSRLVGLRRLPLDGRFPRAASWLLLAALAAFGVWISLGRLAFYMADEEMPVMDFVRQSKGPGEVYLLPIRVPDLARTTRGSLSSDFKPLPAKRQDVRVIPVDLQRFRLETGAPIYVDFKSIPYKDVEVIEWRSRIRFVERIQEQIRQGRLAEVLPELVGRGITHLVQPAGLELAGPGLKVVYADEAYRVYRLSPE